MKLKLKKDLSPLRAAAYAAIDKAAGEARLAYLTDIPGQDELYRLKIAEAEAVVRYDNELGLDVPYLYDEATINGIDLFDQAVIVLTAAEHTRTQLRLIERRRMAAKLAVDRAANPAEIDAAIRLN